MHNKALFPAPREIYNTWGDQRRSPTSEMPHSSQVLISPASNDDVIPPLPFCRACVSRRPMIYQASWKPLPPGDDGSSDENNAQDVQQVKEYEQVLQAVRNCVTVPCAHVVEFVYPAANAIVAPSGYIYVTIYVTKELTLCLGTTKIRHDLGKTRICHSSAWYRKKSCFHLSSYPSLNAELSFERRSKQYKQALPFHL